MGEPKTSFWGTRAEKPRLISQQKGARTHITEVNLTARVGF